MFVLSAIRKVFFSRRFSYFSARHMYVNLTFVYDCKYDFSVSQPMLLPKFELTNGQQRSKIRTVQSDLNLCHPKNQMVPFCVFFFVLWIYIFCFYCDQSPYSPAIKNIFCLFFLQIFVNLKVTEPLIGYAIWFS